MSASTEGQQLGNTGPKPGVCTLPTLGYGKRKAYQLYHREKALTGRHKQALLDAVRQRSSN